MFIKLHFISSYDDLREEYTIREEAVKKSLVTSFIPVDMLSIESVYRGILDNPVLTKRRQAQLNAAKLAMEKEDLSTLTLLQVLSEHDNNIYTGFATETFDEVLNVIND